MRSDLRLQDPIITRMMRTGYPLEYDEIPPLVCDGCGCLIDDYDLDAFIGTDENYCGECWNYLTEEE